MPQNPEVTKALKAVRTSAAKKKEDITIGALSQFEFNGRVFPSGSLGIDTICGVGGLPRGRIAELFGPPASGKTTTALQAAGLAQQAGETIFYMDYEQALDPNYAQALGLDCDDDSFVLMQPDTLEQGINIARKLITSGGLGMLIVDSVASMSTEKELEAETAKRFSEKPALMAMLLRQMNPVVKKTDTCVIFLNHVQQLMDMTPMGQKLAASGVQRKTTPGGDALKFYASLRLEYKQIGSLRSSLINPLTGEPEDAITATKVQVTVVKNKVAPPFGQAELLVRFGKGFSQSYSALQILGANGAIKLDKGGVVRFPPDMLTPDQVEAEHPGWIRGTPIGLADQIDAVPGWEDLLIEVSRTFIGRNNVQIGSLDSTTSDDINAALGQLDETIEADLDPQDELS